MKMNAMRRVPAPDGAIRIGNSRGIRRQLMAIRGILANSSYQRGVNIREITAIILAGRPPLKFYEWHE